MAVKFGKDGTIYCNTVKYNYRQTRNLIVNSDAGLGAVGGIGWSRSSVDSKQTNPNTSQLKSQYCFKFNTGGLAMASQTMPTPTAGHKYYGSLMWRTTGSSFSAADDRFEWYTADSSDGTMVFAHKNVATNGNWVKLSGIQSLSSVRSGSWQIRNFLVNPTTTAYCSRIILIDLTETFGSGNEPTKEWCDENIIEGETDFYVGYSNLGSQSVTTSNYSTVWTQGNMKNWQTYGYMSVDAPYYPREYMYLAEPNSTVGEAYMYSKNGINLTASSTRPYYFSMWYHCDLKNFSSSQAMQTYFPIAEPNMGTVPYVTNTDFNGGGRMEHWKKVSFYTTRTNFSSGSHQLRFDLDNKKTTYKMRITGINMTNTSLLGLNQSLVNKEWFDRHYGGESLPIIRIKNHLNKDIKFTSPMQEMKTTSTFTGTKYQLDSIVGQSNTRWNGVTNAGDLIIGDRAYTRASVSDTGKTARYVIKVNSVSGNTVYGDALGWTYEGGYWYTQTLPYDIVANDVDMDTTATKVTRGKNGTMKCKKLVRNQVY